ncbi:unnamed protein product [Symbiodinium sp. CCMP2456]|nr:unnamed protein product [Symbiodinium sp. CCMP2456]
MKPVAAKLALVVSCFHLLAAVRPSGEVLTQGFGPGIPKCPTARPASMSGQTFLLNMGDFENISIYQDWMLSESADCSNRVGAAVLDPEVNHTNPSESSELWLNILHVQPDVSTVFLCSQRKHHQTEQTVPCLAKLNLKQRRVTLVDMLQPFLRPFLNERVLRGFQSLAYYQQYMFEAFLLAGLLMLAALAVWSSYLFFSAKAEGSRFVFIESSSSKGGMILPSPVDTVLLSLKSSSLFVAGCGLFMAQGCFFFEKHDDATRVGYVLILVFPLVFGSAALLRISISAARCRVYFQALRDGTLVTYKTGLWRSHLLIWFWTGAVLCMGSAARVLWQQGSFNRTGVLQLALLASPLYYMSSSIWNTLAAEATVLKGHCMMALGREESKAELKPMEESALICAARGEASGTPAAEFGIRDLGWVGPYAAKDYFGFQKLVLQFFQPIMLVMLLGLAFLTWKHVLLTFAIQPELKDIMVQGGNLTSQHFFPEKTRYGVVVHTTKPDFTLVALLDQQDPNTMQLSQRKVDAKYEVLQHTAGDQLEQLVNMNTDRYPVDIKVQVNDTSSSVDYSLQMFKFDVVPESITAAGTTVSGEDFRTCVSWDVLCRHPTIYLPSDLTSLSLNVSVLHFIMDVPQKHRREAAYTVQFAPNLTCRTLDFRKRGWVAVQQTQAGCYYVSPPFADKCGMSDHEDIDFFLRSRNLSLEWTFWARSDNDKADNDTVPIVKTTSTSQVSLPLDLPSADSRRGDILLEMDVTMFFDRFDQFPVLGKTTPYAPPNAEIRLHLGAPALDDLYSIKAFCPGVDLSIRKQTTRFEDSDKQWVVLIRDSKKFMEAAVLTLFVVSEYAECSITSLETAASGLLHNLQPKSVLYDDALHTQTASFEFDLAAFREILTRTHAQSVQLLGRTSCTSSFHNVKGHLSIAVWLLPEPLIAVVPEVRDVPLQWDVFPCVQLPLCSVVRIAKPTGGTRIQDVSALALTFLDKGNSSCSAEWIRLSSPDFDSLGEQLQPTSGPEDCVGEMKTTTVCGGNHPSSSVQLGLTSGTRQLALVAKFRCDTFLSPKLKYKVYIA